MQWSTEEDRFNLLCSKPWATLQKKLVEGGGTVFVTRHSFFHRVPVNFCMPWITHTHTKCLKPFKTHKGCSSTLTKAAKLKQHVEHVTTVQRPCGRPDHVFTSFESCKIERMTLSDRTWESTWNCGRWFEHDISHQLRHHLQWLKIHKTTGNR